MGGRRRLPGRRFHDRDLNITVVSRQGITPAGLLGRLNSAYRLLAWGTIPLGALVGGWLAQWLGLQAVFVS